MKIVNAERGAVRCIAWLGFWCGIIVINLGLSLSVEMPIQATICIGYASGALGGLWFLYLRGRLVRKGDAVARMDCVNHADRLPGCVPVQLHHSGVFHCLQCYAQKIANLLRLLFKIASRADVIGTGHDPCNKSANSYTAQAPKCGFDGSAHRPNKVYAESFGLFHI